MKAMWWRSPGRQPHTRKGFKKLTRSGEAAEEDREKRDHIRSNSPIDRMASKVETPPLASLRDPRASA